MEVEGFELVCCSHPAATKTKIGNQEATIFEIPSLQRLAWKTGKFWVEKRSASSIVS